MMKNEKKLLFVFVYSNNFFVFDIFLLVFHNILLIVINYFNDYNDDEYNFPNHYNFNFQINY
jgi:hypothetical protein